MPKTSKARKDAPVPKWAEPFGISAKQAMFVEEYLIDLNATQAAIRAGYSEKTARSQGQRLLTNVDIKRAVKDRIEARSERTKIDQDYILNGINDTVQRCRQAQLVTDREGLPVLVETPDGMLTPAFTFDASNTLKGFELLGKHLGMWKEKVELDFSAELLAAAKAVTQGTPGVRPGGLNLPDDD